MEMIIVCSFAFQLKGRGKGLYALVDLVSFSNCRRLGSTVRILKLTSAR